MSQYHTFPLCMDHVSFLSLNSFLCRAFPCEATPFVHFSFPVGGYMEVAVTFLQTMLTWFNLVITGCVWIMNWFYWRFTEIKRKFPVMNLKTDGSKEAWQLNWLPTVCSSPPRNQIGQFQTLRWISLSLETKIVTWSNTLALRKPLL